MRQQSAAIVKSNGHKTWQKGLRIDETYYFNGIEADSQGALLYVWHMVEREKEEL